MPSATCCHSALILATRVKAAAELVQAGTQVARVIGERGGGAFPMASAACCRAAPRAHRYGIAVLPHE